MEANGFGDTLLRFIANLLKTESIGEERSFPTKYKVIDLCRVPQRSVLELFVILIIVIDSGTVLKI